MTIGSRRASALLFLGDIVSFACSLWITLLVRYGQAPSAAFLVPYLAPFSFLFLVWFVVFFMGGLYEKGILFFKRDLSWRIIRTQVVNIVIAALFFFFVPAFGIAPKTNLLIYLFVSLLLILFWRLVLFPKLAERRALVDAVIVGAGPEEAELAAELSGNPRYGIRCRASIDPKTASVASFDALLAEKSAQLLVVDTRDPSLAPLVPEIYRRAFEQDAYQIVDLLALYEEVFDRVPLTLVGYEWFFRYATRQASGFYLFLKRAIDIIGGLLMGIVTIVATPFVWLAMRLEGPGPLFIRQDRIGEHETRVRSYKFRSMRYSDEGAWRDENRENYVTRVGAFLRKTSLDEFPQFVNVLAGELSLIGPRNDIDSLGKRLAEALPYYRVRYLVKPGITGWAQVNQQYEQGNLSPQSIEETKMRLAYDFYYLKHRSFMLDIVIALKTVKRMFFRLSPQ